MGQGNAVPHRLHACRPLLVAYSDNGAQSRLDGFDMGTWCELEALELEVIQLSASSQDPFPFWKRGRFVYSTKTGSTPGRRSFLTSTAREYQALPAPDWRLGRSRPW